jgi:plastocyanin
VARRTRVAPVGLILAIVAAALLASGAAGKTAEKRTYVTVVATDKGFELSRAKVPVGTVAFTVRNAGSRAHDFEIAGVKTKALRPGGRATLRVRLAKPGRVTYVSTVSGRPQAGFRGVLTVERVTTVDVSEFEFGFRLSHDTVPAGKVVFRMRNDGAILHNFDVIGVAVGAFLVPGQTATMTATLKPGTYTYVCSVKYHAAQGMQGTLTVK